MADSEDSYLYYPESEYVNQIPTPPRIDVPPPSLHATPFDLRLKPSLGDPMLESLRFLDNYNCGHFNRPWPTYSWTYEDRRRAQQILPFLYLGPMNAVWDRDFLRQQGITMLLAIRPTQSKQSSILNKALRVADELGLQKGTVDIGTIPEIVASLPTAIRMINEHLTEAYQSALHQNGQSLSAQNTNPGKVLVFDESGNDRAAGVVVAYIMQMFEDMTLVKAVQLVQARRFCLNVDDTMKSLLSSYGDIIQAEQDVALSAQQVSTESQTAQGMQSGLLTSKGSASLKRGADDFVDDDDEDMDGYGACVSGRGVAPFRDIEQEL